MITPYITSTSTHTDRSIWLPGNMWTLLLITYYYKYPTQVPISITNSIISTGILIIQTIRYYGCVFVSFRPSDEEKSVIRTILGAEEQLIIDEDFIIEEDEDEGT